MVTILHVSNHELLIPAATQFEVWLCGCSLALELRVRMLQGAWMSYLL